MSEPPSRNPKRMAAYSKFHRNGIRLSIPALGTMRRVQALNRIGYTNSQIAAGAGLGCSRQYVSTIANGRRERVYLNTARRITDFYERAQMRPRDDAHAKKTITHAIKKKWAPPFAWDDIDNDEQPADKRYQKRTRKAA